MKYRNVLEKDFGSDGFKVGNLNFLKAFTPDNSIRIIFEYFRVSVVKGKKIKRLKKIAS